MNTLFHDTCQLRGITHAQSSKSMTFSSFEVSEDDVVTFVYARRSEVFSELVSIGTFTQYSLSHPHTPSKLQNDIKKAQKEANSRILKLEVNNQC